MHEVDDAIEQDSEAEIVTTHDRLTAVHRDFDDLLARTGAPASARWETIDPWFRHHPRFRPWGVFMWSRGEIVAGTLLAHTARAGVHLFKTAGHIGAPSWMPAVDLNAARSLGRAMRGALDALGEPWILHLRDLPVPDPVVSALRLELALSTSEPGPPMARMYFAPGEPLGAYLSRNTKSAVAKALNRIQAAGLKSELSWTRDPAEIDRCTGEIVDVHRRRGRQMQGRSSLDDANAAALFIDTIHAHAHANRVRLLTLRLEGHLAAFALCEEAAGTLWVDTNRASPDWLVYSPGTIVNAEVVRAAHADPLISCIDWGGGIQRYKLSGNVTICQLQSLHAWSSRATWLIWSGLQAGRRALLRRLTGHTPVGV